MHSAISLGPEVAKALTAGRPLVALESALISHGLPQPDNIACALAMEAEVRRGGATPATIALLGGRLTCGLSQEQIEYLGSRPAGAVRKCSRRDLAPAVARGEDGATTVAGSLVVAHLAGIGVFATGGIGGVHRGHPFDVSADLIELGRTPLAVVCSGAKSILDLPLTLEVLETQGVAVVGYGTDELPAFFSRTSGLPLAARADTPAEAADMIRAQRALGLASGLLIAVPPPAEAALEAEAAEAAIAQAAREADAAGVSGQAATPWLLRRVAELSAGASLRANLALLRHNAWLAGKIAAALCAAEA